MTEVSYIVQNGQKVYFKDTAGRELLTQKQVKLKAGRGISIAEDGTISATGGSGSANGFFINASGELNNLTFDKTPVELNTAIENGNIVIVSANNAKFVLTDVKDGTYLFSYLVVLGEEDCLAQMATISATSDGSNWTEIKTNFISIKTAQKQESVVLEDKYHEDDDLGVDFSGWSEYNSYAEDKNVIQFRETDYYGSQYVVADFIDQNGNCVIDKIKDGYLEIPEVVEKIKGIVLNNYYDTYINSDYIEESPDGKLELTVMRFKDLFNLEIADADVQKELPNTQDTLVISNEFEISDDGTISLKEGYINE